MNWLVEQLVVPVMGMVLTALVAWAAATFSKWSGIQIEARHREALHSALMTGVRMAISQFGPNANKAQITQAAVTYAESSVPDAMRKLNPSPDHLSSMAEAKLVEAIGG